MLNEVLEFQVRPLSENQRKMRALLFARFLQQVFAGGIIFKRLPMLAAQKTPKKPVHDPDPAIGMGPARVNTCVAFPVHMEAPSTHLVRIQIQVRRRVSRILEHVFCQIWHIFAYVRNKTTLDDL